MYTDKQKIMVAHDPLLALLPLFLNRRPVPSWSIVSLQVLDSTLLSGLRATLWPHVRPWPCLRNQ
jgi:hypothetical protein